MTATTARREIDVSHLPPTELDTRSPTWWGNTLLLFIETTTVALLIVTYLYLWRNNPLKQWPPPKTSTTQSILDPLPDIGLPTLDLALLAAAAGVMAWLDLQARRRFRLFQRLNVSSPDEAPQAERPESRPTAVLIAMAVLFAIGVIDVIVRFQEFEGLKIAWNENAYGSTVWAILGIHLTYLGLAAIEIGLVTLWFLIYGFDQSNCIDVTLTAVYWYWTAGTWLLLYGLVYWFPRLVGQEGPVA